MIQAIAPNGASIPQSASDAHRFRIAANFDLAAFEAIMASSADINGNILGAQQRIVGTDGYAGFADEEIHDATGDLDMHERRAALVFPQQLQPSTPDVQAMESISDLAQSCVKQFLVRCDHPGAPCEATIVLSPEVLEGASIAIRREAHGIRFVLRGKLGGEGQRIRDSLHHHLASTLDGEIGIIVEVEEEE